MKKISSLNFKKDNKTVEKGFSLVELKNLNVITGENNSGKTNFMQGVKDGKVDFFDDAGCQIKNVNIVYIAAENIEPDQTECKTSAESSNLFENLSNLFSSLGVTFTLNEQDKVKETVNSLFSKLNLTLESFSFGQKYLVTNQFNESLKPGTILKALISKIETSEGDEKRKLEDLGQGTQRLIILSILKAYVDILLEKGVKSDHLTLILFEEPEVYLHPRLKKTLNNILKTIADTDNNQIIITTHDPYFAFSNFRGDNNKVYSFSRNEKNLTEPKPDIISGIEDELLHILLFNMALESKKGINDLDAALLKLPKVISKKYIDDRDNSEKTVALPVYVRHQIHHPNNKINVPYTAEELIESIKILNLFLSK